MQETLLPINIFDIFQNTRTQYAAATDSILCFVKCRMERIFVIILFDEYLFVVCVLVVLLKSLLVLLDAENATFKCRFNIYKHTNFLLRRMVADN